MRKKTQKINDAARQKLIELKQKEVAVLQQMKAYRDANLIEFFDKKPNPGPNPLQAELLEVWQDPVYKVFTYTGANRCLGGEVKIYDPIKKESLPVSEIKEDFHVYAWDGEKIVIAKAEKPFKKYPVEALYRIELSNGHSFVASEGHRVLTGSKYSSISELQIGDPVCDLSPTVERGLKVQSGDAQNLENIAQDSQSDCPSYHRFYDERLPLDQDNDLYILPSLGDVLKRNLIFEREGGQESTQGHTRQHLGSCLLSNQGVLIQSVDLFSEFLYHASCTVLTLFDFCKRFVQLPIFVYGLLPQSKYGFDLQASHVSCNDYNRDSHCCYSSYDAPLLDTNKFSSQAIITSIKYARDDVKWDFTVPKYHNYYCEGSIHHNTGKTTIGCIIATSTILGKFPWSNQRIQFPHNKPRKVRIVGQDWEKHIRSVVLPELEKWWPDSRPVKKKKNNQGIDATWIDEKTGGSIEIMSNNQDSDLHEGWQGDLIYYDEPPKRPIRVANARGLVDRQGREIFCMTLLKEAWVDREIIKAVLDDGRPDPTVFNIQGDIYSNVGYGITAEGVEQFAKTLTEDEKSARLNGVPSYMSGLVYPQFSRKLHLKRRFQIPLNWIVDIAIDIHPREKQAILFMATSERGDRYLINEIWDNGDGTWIGENIIRCIKQNSYRVGSIIIDPLSKSDGNNENTVYDKVNNVLFRYGYALKTASKDKSSGIMEVKNHLMGPNNEPSLFIFDDLIRFLYEIEGYMWDKDTQKPMDKDDHMMENMYRLLLLNTQWSADDYEEEWRDYGSQSRDAYTGY